MDMVQPAEALRLDHGKTNLMSFGTCAFDQRWAARPWSFSVDPAAWVRFSCPSRPNWFVRFWQRVFLGIRWHRVG